MTGNPLRQYRFNTKSQWKACLLAQNDRDAPDSEPGFRPFPPFAAQPAHFESQDARAPVVLRTGEMLWCDGQGMLHWAVAGDATSEAFPAPPSIAHASRIVSTAGSLWVKSAERESLECYDEETLTQLFAFGFPNSRILDIAGGERDTLLVLVDRGDDLQYVRLSRSGHEVETVSISGTVEARSFIYLHRSRNLVVLDGGHRPRLCWFAAAGGQALFSRPIGAIQPCFSVDVLGSDSVDKIVLAGSTTDVSGTGHIAVILDSDGSRLGEVKLTAQAAGITAARQSLVVADVRGLWRYATSEVVPNTQAEVRCTLITPLLQSVGLEGSSPWLRVEATARLPEGTTLEIACAATDDAEVRDRVIAIAEDARLPAGERIQSVLSEPGLWSPKTTFHGRDRAPDVSEAPRSAPLFDLRGRYLWVCVTLTAAPGARLPAVTDLVVWYPGHSLMENLPFPYRRDAATPGDFLRSLVGVLEATTQNLDARIAALGSHIHPATAAGPWMDTIAGWLGLPWDDALSESQKRALLLCAPQLARGRGTRAGLELLLECLMPGTPRRYRVTDTMVDYGYALVGGDQCAGSPLPAMLGGYTRWHAELNATVVLGSTCLPSPTQANDGAQWPAAKVRVEVAAGRKEREAWGPWLRTLIGEMAPLTVGVELRWVSAQALPRDRLDDTLVLEAPPSPHLGGDAVTGLARLPAARRTRLAGAGPVIGTPLR